MQAVHTFTICRHWWDRWEAAIGLVAAFALAFGPLTVSFFAMIFSLFLGEWSALGVAALITAVTCPMAIWLARMADAALKRFRRQAWADAEDNPAPADDTDTATTPFAIYLAAELPRLPLAVRLPLALWWLAHFLAGTVLVEFADVVAEKWLLVEGIANGVLAVLLGFVFHFAANVFLVLAVTACFDSPKITASIWRKRVIIDSVATLPLVVRLWM